MRDGGGDDPLEQAWRLRELRDRFGLSALELARRFDKSVSWVSRRLSLVNALPLAVQEHVRKGAIVAYGAMKYLAPLARANRNDCIKIADGIAAHAASTRQMRELYVAYIEADEETRKRIVENPSLFLRAATDAVSQPEIAPSAARVLSEDLGQMGGVARRLHRRLREGVARRVRPHERDDVSRCASQAETDTCEAVKRLRKEFEDAGRNDASGDIHPA